jgi:hypothetical protein
VTLPRPVYPNSALMVTRNCTQGMFLLRPDRETVNAFIYCLAVAAQRHEIDIMGFIQMSNHLHDLPYDRQGNAPAFYEDFHRLLAKCVNCLRGRWENVFSSKQTSVVRIETRDDVINKLVYIATNPVKDGLVARVADWPGANGFRALVTGEVLTATRPKVFFSKRGTMPATITLKVGIPPELGPADEIIAEVERRVALIEEEKAQERARTGKSVLGRNAVLRQRWDASPTSRKPRRVLSPTIAARNLWARLEAIQRKHEFVAEYRSARAALLAGSPIPFPHGTYWLRRFVAVAVTPAPVAENN